jgi:hypothetical protein
MALGLTREQRRSRRKRPVRARTVNLKGMQRGELADAGVPIPATQPGRPRTRGQCASVPRPCPYISCKHHLYLDVSPRTGSIKLNFPDLEAWELRLDIAEESGCTLETVGEIMNLTRERIRQLETSALARLQAVGDMRELRDLAS